MSPRMLTASSSARIRRAAAACLLAAALVLMAEPVGGVHARWLQSQPVANADIRAGELSMFGEGAFVRLWSRQPTASRTYLASAANCPAMAVSPGSEYIECRQYPWGDFATEELVPGDQVAFVQPLTVQVDGSNLTATVSIGGDSDLGGLSGTGTTAQVWVSEPETVSRATSASLTRGRDQKRWAGMTLSIPPTNGGAGWGSQLRGATFTPRFSISLTQTFPGEPG